MKRNSKQLHLWLFQFFADFSAIVAAYFFTYFLRFHSDVGGHVFTFINRATGVRDTGDVGGSLEEFYIISAPRIIIILTCVLCVLYALVNLYSERRFILKKPVAWHLLRANVVALVVFYAYFYLQRNVFHPRSYFITVLFFNGIFCVLFRFWSDKILDYLRSHYSIDQHTAIVVGANKDADYIRSVIDVLHPHGLEVVGRVIREDGKPFEELIQETKALAANSEADVLIVADNEFTINEIMRFMETADDLGVSVKVLSDKMSVLQAQAKMPMDHIHGVPLVHFNKPRQRGLRNFISSVLSKSAALVLLVLFVPVMSLVALLIKLTSRGPVMFIQERVGVNRRSFKMYKFRTMYDRAEEAQAQLEEFNEAEAMFKIKRDPRVTAVGRLLRRFSIDELPQLINAVKGDMRIVGPRPLPKRDFENYYEDWHYGRHEGVPGLTCLWQISGRSDIDFHNMCILDVYYLRNRNWLLDLRIFIRTIWVVLFGRGAY